tara:strand:+ start:207 stop:482 length:276 start_codon:yes stop_codon:yes gene_type:complete
MSLLSLKKQEGGTHYKKLAIQPIEYCQRNNLNHCESSVVKYVTRWKDKNGVEDLKKAIHYLEYLIELEESTKEYNEQLLKETITEEFKFHD